MRGSAIAWLGHPVSVVAIVVLTVNDHVLKGAYPGPVTGKVSDFAGLVFAPALLALGLSALGLRGERSALGAVLATGAGFVLVKTTSTGARIAGEAWGLVAGPSLIRADPTDLLALPALVVSWQVHRWARNREIPERRVRLGRVVVVMPFAVVATAATSAPLAQSVDAVGTSGDRIVVRAEATTISTTDGGVTWMGEESGRADDQIRDGATRACVPSAPSHCYRVVEGRLAVQETTDGRTWRTAWEISQGRTDFLRRQAVDKGYDSDISSRALAVQDQAGGHVVVVANGGDGLVVRDTSGTWRRLGHPVWTVGASRTVEPITRWNVPDLEDGSAYRFRAGFTALIVLASALLAGLGSGRSLRWGCALTLGGAVSGLGLHSMDLLGVAVAPLSATLILVGLVLLGVGSSTAADRRRVFCVVPIALAGALLAPVPLLSWTTGVPDAFRTAVLGSVLIGCAGTVAAFLTGRAVARGR